MSTRSTDKCFEDARSILSDGANPAFEKMLSYDTRELTGVPTRNLFPSEQAYEDLGARAYPLLNEGKVFRSHIQLLRKDQVIIWVDIAGSIQNAESGESLWAFVDITESKQNQNRIERLVAEQKAILHNELVGIVTVKDRKILL